MATDPSTFDAAMLSVHVKFFFKCVIFIADNAAILLLRGSSTLNI